MADEAALIAERAANAAVNPEQGSAGFVDLRDRRRWDIAGAANNPVDMTWNTATALTVASVEASRNVAALYLAGHGIVVSGGVLVRASAEAAGLVVHLTDLAATPADRVARMLSLHIVSLNHLASVRTEDWAAAERDLLRAAGQSFGFDPGKKLNFESYGIGNSQAAELGLRLEDTPDVRRIAEIARSYISGLAHGMIAAVRLERPTALPEGAPKLELRGGEPQAQIVLWAAAVTALRAAEALNAWSGATDHDFIGLWNRVVRAFATPPT